MIFYESSFLAHHGIKGQRWGVRRYQNPDGTLTEAGKARLKDSAQRHAEEYAKIHRNNVPHWWEKQDDVSNDLKREVYPVYSNLKKAADEHKRIMAEQEAYFANGDAVDKYSTLKGIIDAKEFGITDPAEIEYEIWLNKYEDLDQGYKNSFDLYLIDNGKSPKEFGRKEFDAKEKLNKAAEEAAKDILGKIGDKTIDTGTIRPSTYSKLVADMLTRGHFSCDVTPNLDEAAVKREIEDAYKDYDKYKDLEPDSIDRIVEELRKRK